MVNNYKVVHLEDSVRFIVAILCPGAGFDDLLQILRKEQVQCVNILKYRHDLAFSEYLSASIASIDNTAVSLMFIFNSRDCELVETEAGLQRIKAKLEGVVTN